MTTVTRQQMIEACLNVLIDEVAEITSFDLTLPPFTTLAPLRATLRALQAEPAHSSDCAVHNGPAYPAGTCDCRAFHPRVATDAMYKAAMDYLISRGTAWCVNDLWTAMYDAAQAERGEGADVRFVDLKPQFWQRYRHFSPETGGTDPLPEIELSFTCPKCGSPGIVSIIVGTGTPETGRWHVDALPSLENPAPRYFESLTVTPSIQCHALQHGPRRPACNAHFSIINGAIIP